MENENLRSMTHYQLIMTPRTLKTVAKYLVSISVFTFIYYSQYSSWCCFMLHSMKFYLSAITLHTLDKRWTFLICNGILVVLASTSGLVSSRPSLGVDLNDRMVRIKIGDYQHISPAETKDKWSAEPIENAVAEVEEEEEKEIYQEALEEEEYGKSQDDQCFELEQGGLLSLNLIEEDHEEEEVGSGVLVKLEEGGEREAKGEEIRTYYALEDDHHQETEEALEAADFLAEDMQVEEEEEEEEAEHGMEKLSADELNKKFEDFIRKMKEELRIEAQQQLVVVVK